ncbi:hypothetical protein ANN_23134 [Periplaneta americana]|uniref:Uncharacterized protein n=1 Tax=Periplaneta americana TaxID=6978 RepID=A0ABQ8SLP6_PERAM|nr:hypothetical protein ANN_23134 [Periplaneta americana]
MIMVCAIEVPCMPSLNMNAPFRTEGYHIEEYLLSMGLGESLDVAKERGNERSANRPYFGCGIKTDTCLSRATSAIHARAQQCIEAGGAQNKEIEETQVESGGNVDHDFGEDYNDYNKTHFDIGCHARIPTRNTILRWEASFRITGSTLKKKSPGRNSIALRLSEATVRSRALRLLSLGPFEGSLTLLGREFQSRGTATVKEDEYEDVRWEGMDNIEECCDRVSRL